jgi:hypothetical protein
MHRYDFIRSLLGVSASVEDDPAARLSQSWVSLPAAAARSYGKDLMPSYRKAGGLLAGKA